jgi:kelch-like protein 18
MDGYIYVLGGSDGQQELSSAEAFDLNTGIWLQLPHMVVRRHGLAAVALAGKLFALGGFDGRQELASVELFDPNTCCAAGSTRSAATARARSSTAARSSIRGTRRGP